MPVIGFEVSTRRPAGGRPEYEEWTGRLRVRLDPDHPANRRVTDLHLAERTAERSVEWTADVSILLPVDRRICSGRILLDVVNRGHRVAVPNFNMTTAPATGEAPQDLGDGFLMKRGWVVVSCGWQTDLPDAPGLVGAHPPPLIQPVSGWVFCELQADEPVNDLLLADRGHRPFPAERRGPIRRMPHRPRCDRRGFDRHSPASLVVWQNRGRADGPNPRYHHAARRLRDRTPVPDLVSSNDEDLDRDRPPYAP